MKVNGGGCYFVDGKMITLCGSCPHRYVVGKAEIEVNGITNQLTNPCHEDITRVCVGSLRNLTLEGGLGDVVKFKIKVTP